MKKFIQIISVVLAVVLCSAVIVAADTIESSGKTYYYEKGTERLTVTSSYSPELSAEVSTAVFFDHSKDTGVTFDFSEADEKTVSVLIGSRQSEQLAAFGIIMDVPEDTTVKVSVYATDDADFNEWTEVKAEATGNDGTYSSYKVSGIDKGYAFYKFVFEVTEGDEFSLAEISLLKPEAKTTLPSAAGTPSSTIRGQEMWRKAQALHRPGSY